MILFVDRDRIDANLIDTQQRIPVEVPTVAFYGEAGDWSTAALLHSELLIERSSLHAWRIRPHRHSNLVQLFWLATGRGTARFDSQARWLESPCIAVVPERCVHEFEWSQDSTGFALSLACVLIHELHAQLGLSDSMFRQAAVLEVSEDTDYIDTLFRQIQTEYSCEQELREIALDSLARSLAVWIARRAPVRPRSEPARRSKLHFGRFTSLLEQHHREQWTVAGYAHAIGVSASHLNAICQERAGASAKHLIQDRVLLAARRELAYTDKSITDVAASLGFAEASYFTRFFKRRMYMTPKQYRRHSGTYSGIGEQPG